MIQFTRGDLLAAQAEAIVNTVNCVGVMGRGIALQMKNAFPENFRAYAAACRRGEVEPGKMLIVETGELGNPRYIINFPTKRHWRGRSRLSDIEAGLVALVADVRRLGIRSLALPPLGCGLGGLAWDDVRPLIERAFSDLPDVQVTMFEPSGAPDPAVMKKASAPPKMTPGRAAVVELMHRYLAGLMEPFVTLLEVHKLAYFLQESGEPLRLRYAKAPYGPFAENLSHVLKQIEGHLISGYADGGDRPDKRLELVPGAIAEAAQYLRSHEDTRSRFDRVAALVDGFETPFGLELLSTVHWVATREGATQVEALAPAIYAWGERKRRFLPDQIALAHERLLDQGWLTSSASASL
jgi:O-acetyl-ADP-ribose deacetylase (regulator of RNase III)